MGRKDKATMKEAAQENRKKDREIRKKHHQQKIKDFFKLSPLYIKYYKDLNNQLGALALEMRDVGGDGNCLFRSVSDQIEGEEVLH